MRKQKIPKINQHRPSNRRQPPMVRAQSIHTTSQIPKYEKGGSTTKIAIIQTGSYGDNINSTLMFKPLKQHYQDSIIDVHTSTYYWNAFDNNPYISNIIKHTAYNKNDALHLGVVLPEQLSNSNYDIIINAHPMFNHEKWSSSRHQEWGENLIFAWVRAIEDLNIPYDIPLETVLNLRAEEVQKVTDFTNNIELFSQRRKNIAEIHGESGQTFWNDGWTVAMVDKLCGRGEIVFISHRDKQSQLEAKYPGLCHSVNHLTIRECAELFNKCDKFFSVSSGLSNVCNTNWCKKDIEWVEVVNSQCCSSAAIRRDGKTFWHDNDLNKFINSL